VVHVRGIAAVDGHEGGQLLAVVCLRTSCNGHARQTKVAATGVCSNGSGWMVMRPGCAVLGGEAGALGGKANVDGMEQGVLRV
jgi:hypothetical protein